MGKTYLNRLNGLPTDRTPAWLMRQAGRYLPEYRELRAKAGGFWELVYDPAFASAVTLQPIQRFDLDAAILFADILVLPHALGQEITFGPGEGPRLDPIRDFDALKRLNPAKLMNKVSIVCETVGKVAAQLPDHVTMIGFAGAPWTVAAYMIEGQGSRDYMIAKTVAYAQPDLMAALLDIIVSATATYCVAQVRAGAEVIQIFDSWAGVLNETDFHNWVIKPTRRLVQLIRDMLPADKKDIPIVGFPRGAGVMADTYAAQTKVTALQLDTTTTLSHAQSLADKLPVQGWMDPALLVAGGKQMLAAIDTLKDGMSGRNLIFNLGHGIVPQTPPEHVAQLLERLRA